MDKKDKQLFEKIKESLIKKAEGFYYNEEVVEFINDDGEIKKEIKNSSKPVSEESKMKNSEVKQKSKNDRQNQKSKDLTCFKKKVTTHYVPPDILAIKMLIEIFGEKMNNSSPLSKMTLTELEDLKNNLIEKLKN